MKFKFLGTAAAEGIPGPFCACENCRLAREEGGRSIRGRSQALVDDCLLIDFPADTAQTLLFISFLKILADLRVHFFINLKFLLIDDEADEDADERKDHHRKLHNPNRAVGRIVHNVFRVNDLVAGKTLSDGIDAGNNECK